MRSLLAIAVLMSTALPAFADVRLVPEPETLWLVVPAVVGLLLARRRRK